MSWFVLLSTIIAASQHQHVTAANQHRAIAVMQHQHATAASQLRHVVDVSQGVALQLQLAAVLLDVL